MIFLVFSYLLKVSKLQNTRKHKENHHLCKINRFFFPLFGKVPGWRWPAGWLAWELARLAGLACALRSISALLYTLCAALHVYGAAFFKFNRVVARNFSAKNADVGLRL